jgi:hypothetical protein
MHTGVTSAIARIVIHVCTHLKLKEITNNDCDGRFIYLEGRPNCSLSKLEIVSNQEFFVSKIKEQLAQYTYSSIIIF